jgi:hypothetical protein
MSNHFIRLYETRKAFHFMGDDLSEIDILDISKGLSQVNRYTGHTKQAYSVAEHSIHVASLLPPELQIYGLLHDASEAYLNDISSPLKDLLPDYRAIEEHVQNKVWMAFGLDPKVVAEVYPIVKAADWKMLLAEMKTICPDDYAAFKAGGDTLVAEVEAHPILKDPEFPFYVSPQIACGVFRKVFRKLNEGVYLEGPFSSMTEMTKYLMK